MSFTYTNRKGTTYYLCKGKTKRGNARYYFSRQPKDEPVERVPEGYEIRENINGRVSIGKIRPKIIRNEEVQVVKTILSKHPEGTRYQVDAKGKNIYIYEPVGPGFERLSEIFGGILPISPKTKKQLAASYAQSVQYTPVIRFKLTDKEERHFELYRMGYSGRGGWQSVWLYGNLSMLAGKAIPTLGTDQFFTLGM